MIIYYVQYLTVNISVAINVQYQECYIFFLRLFYICTLKSGSILNYDENQIEPNC